jgi:hypothetical protein
MSLMHPRHALAGAVCVMIVHPRDQDLVLATHGRSLSVLDDITALQQLSTAVLAKNEHLFRPRGAILWDEDKRTWHGGGDELWRARNPPDAILAYYLKAAASGPVKVQIVELDGKVIREIDGAGQPGIHRVPWDLKATGGGRVGPGIYAVRLVANGRTTSASIDVATDPNR